MRETAAEFLEKIIYDTDRSFDQKLKFVRHALNSYGKYVAFDPAEAASRAKLEYYRRLDDKNRRRTLRYLPSALWSDEVSVARAAEVLLGLRGGTEVKKPYHMPYLPFYILQLQEAADRALKSVKDEVTQQFTDSFAYMAFNYSDGKMHNGYTLMGRALVLGGVMPLPVNDLGYDNRFSVAAASQVLRLLDKKDIQKKFKTINEFLKSTGVNELLGLPHTDGALCFVPAKVLQGNMVVPSLGEDVTVKINALTNRIEGRVELYDCGIYGHGKKEGREIIEFYARLRQNEEALEKVAAIFGMDTLTFARFLETIEYFAENEVKFGFRVDFTVPVDPGLYSKLVRVTSSAEALLLPGIRPATKGEIHHRSFDVIPVNWAAPLTFAYDTSFALGAIALPGSQPFPYDLYFSEEKKKKFRRMIEKDMEGMKQRFAAAKALLDQCNDVKDRILSSRVSVRPVVRAGDIIIPGDPLIEGELKQEKVMEKLRELMPALRFAGTDIHAVPQSYLEIYPHVRENEAVYKLLKESGRLLGPVINTQVAVLESMGQLREVAAEQAQAEDKQVQAEDTEIDEGFTP